MTVPTHCPSCNHKLQERKAGLVCKNWKCKLYWKYGGWAYDSKVWLTDKGKEFINNINLQNGTTKQKASSRFIMPYFRFIIDKIDKKSEHGLQKMLENAQVYKVYNIWYKKKERVIKKYINNDNIYIECKYYLYYYYSFLKSIQNYKPYKPETLDVSSGMFYYKPYKPYKPELFTLENVSIVSLFDDFRFIMPIINLL